MKRLSFLLSLILLLIAAISPAQAQRIEPDVPPGVFTDPNWLTIDFHRVNVTIDNQVATTTVDMQFTNNGEALAEGTFIFPLPANAAIDRLTMFIDGVAYDAKILDADEARRIYDEIVRQYRDPALLEYVGTQAVQANVFPIPQGESRRIQIDYSQLLEVDNGLVEYNYPISSDRAVQQMSITVDVTSNDAISAVYSPTHNMSVVRDGEFGFRAGWEAAPGTISDDFTLYYGVASDTINVNLLTYRESATDDGFFMLLVQPPLTVEEENITPKDVVLVLDQSGSMEGEKWDQARAAAAYVLRNLNPNDRFNLVVFSTGTRVYAPESLPASDAEGAISWLDGLFAEGGTNISDALTQALGIVGERPTAIIFLTDGEATEGIVETDGILTALQAADQPNARVFTFGVGDDVNTFLLDAIVRDFRGTGTYVRPGQRIDEAVASLYNKIDAPVLSNIELDFGDGIIAELMYPNQISDLFAGEQLTIVGRYRGDAANLSITLSGTVDGQPESFVYSDLSFPALAGGETFIARLWATRHIADLLNTIRLNGETPELVDSVVSLSLRYGIITPYTSFLIEEDDILTQSGRERASVEAGESFDDFSDEETGADAVTRSQSITDLSEADAPASVQPPADLGVGDDLESESADGFGGFNPIQTVGDKTFIQLDGVWTDTVYEPDVMETEQVMFLSDAYFDLLDANPALRPYFALGEQVIVVVDGVAYEVIPEA